MAQTLISDMNNWKNRQVFSIKQLYDFKNFNGWTDVLEKQFHWNNTKKEF